EEHDAGEVRTELSGAQASTSDSGIHDVDDTGRPALYDHKVVEGPMRDCGELDPCEISRFERERFHTEPVVTGHVGERLRGHAVPTDVARTIAFRNGCPASPVGENHRKACGAAFECGHLREHSYAT